MVIVVHSSSSSGGGGDSSSICSSSSCSSSCSSRCGIGFGDVISFSCRDVTNFMFAFENMRILTTFQLFDIRQIVGGISVECEYFILCNLTEFN